MNKQKSVVIPIIQASLFFSEEERVAVLKMQAYKLKEIYGPIFTCEETTPDLMKMFGLISVKRTSSAVWRTPPRYSTLPKY
jgi:hypothetical protein